MDAALCADTAHRSQQGGRLEAVKEEDASHQECLMVNHAAVAWQETIFNMALALRAVLFVTAACHLASASLPSP